jgi:hypothetical protein
VVEEREVEAWLDWTREKEVLDSSFLGLCADLLSFFAG